MPADPLTPVNVDDFGLEMVPRGCHLQPYTKISVAPFKIRDEFIAYASPDSTYAVTKQLIEGATKSILIGIYDFTALYMVEMLLSAMERGVRVSLMLDVDSDAERDIFQRLIDHGGECVEAPSCASQAVQYFSSSHEKVIIIDGEWVLVQSGNYSNNSIPANEVDGGDGTRFKPGNRDMGVAVRSPKLADFFTRILRADMKKQTDAEGNEALVPDESAFAGEDFLLERAPSRQPAELFPSKRFTADREIVVMPVLSPDNYMDLIPDVLKHARKSIYIEQQYIKPKKEGSAVRRLLAAIGEALAANPNLDLRVVVARPLSRGPAFDKDVAEIESLAEFNLPMGARLRILNPEQFVHCHNKLIVIDDERVLVSSQNWSDAAVTKNREAGLLINDAPIARYYSNIFRSDWDNALTSLGDESVAEADLFPANALNQGMKLVRIARGDYVDPGENVADS